MKNFTAKKFAVLLIIFFLTACSSTSNVDKKIEDDADTLNTSEIIVSLKPEKDALDISIDDTISTNFNDSMDPSTITNESFVLADSDGNIIEGEVSYNEETKTITFTPKSSLAPGKQYTVTIKNTIKNKDGIPLSESFSWTFTTVASSASSDISYPMISTRRHITCMINSSQDLYCWGDIKFSEIDRSQSEVFKTPQKIGEDKWITVDTGTNFICGIKKDNKLYCWGGIYYDGSYNFVENPELISDMSWKQVSLGYLHGCAITTDNDLYCWGINDSGNLGIGTTENQRNPVHVGTDKWKKIEAGHSRFTCGINMSNELYCWGNNAKGRLGINSSEGYATTPTRVGADKWKDIVLGEQSACGIKASGKTYCWGYNYYSLGTASTENSINKPELVVTDVTFKDISAGNFFIYGISNTNHLYRWGGDLYCNLGISGVSVIETPTKLGGDTWKDISGGYQVCGIKTDNKAYCWGSNNIKGELGIGDREYDECIPQLVEFD